MTPYCVVSPFHSSLLVMNSAGFVFARRFFISRGADALERNCRARIGTGREVEFARTGSPSASRTAIRSRRPRSKPVLPGGTASGKPLCAGERNSCSFRSVPNCASTESGYSQTEKRHGPPENQFKNICERIWQSRRLFAFSALHKGRTVSICPSRFADASIRWFGGAKRMKCPGGNETTLHLGFSWQNGRAEGNESPDRIARRSFAALPDNDCVSCDASMGVGANRQRI